MDYDKLINKALESGRDGNLDALNDAFGLIRSLEVEGAADVMDINGVRCYDSTNFRKAHTYIRALRTIGAEGARRGSAWYVDLYKRCLLFDAPHFLDEAILYAEFDRPFEKKFYEPRRKQLKRVVDAMQRLENREIHTLGVMMPPGVGKSTIEIMFLVWSAFRNYQKSILMGSHSNSLLNGVYGEILRMLEPNGEYKWREIFPNVPLTGTSAKDMRIDLGTRKRFETIEFASVGAGNAGRVRASNILALDDLVDGIESAMSRDRMDKLWQQFYTDYLQRQMDDCALLLVATPWSLSDPIDRLEEMHRDDPDAEFIHLPALDENDRSNFEYPCGVGFSTEFYHEQRAIMDDASWRALYMCEPIERDGQLYAPDELRRFYDLPDGDAETVIAVCDQADGAGDFWSMPILAKYGNEWYLKDWIFDNGKPDVVEERIVNALISNKVKAAQFESNRGGGRVAESIQKRVKERGGITKITTKWSQSNKDTRIVVSSGSVKQNIVFMDESVCSKEYKSALNNLYSYSMSGKKAKHDDAPDSLAMAVDFIDSFAGCVVSVLKRPF